MSLSNNTISDMLETARSLGTSFGVSPYSLLSIPVETLALKGDETLPIKLEENTDVMQGAIGIYLYDDYSLKDMENYFRHSQEAAGLSDEDLTQFLDNRLTFHKYPGKLQEWKLYKAAMIAGALMRIIATYNFKFCVANTDAMLVYRADLFTRRNLSLYMLLLLY
jgi:hypothetical protein